MHPSVTPSLPTPLSEHAPRRVTILGSTGTIGQNALRLIREHKEKFRVTALTAGRNVDQFIKDILEFEPEFAVIADERFYDEVKEATSHLNVTIATGGNALEEASSFPTDIFISGLVGAMALRPTLAAIKQGHTIGLANKECLVCAGEIMMSAVRQHGASLVPIDSEHNCIFQNFDFDHPESIEKITLTASGGPFRMMDREALAHVTPEQAVSHPNWTMGAKISVDSATMMNKGLEVIEAFHLFPVEKEQIDVLVHPESVIHCLVYYRDGSVLSGLSSPDMRVPISYALGWPKRLENTTTRLDLAALGQLTFEQPDTQKFPALTLARDALNQGGTAPAILNAANEIAVESFLEKKIGFLDITNTVQQALEIVSYGSAESLEHILEADAEARRITKNIIETGR